ncbi:hypothetical protein DEU56DRAFT_780486 [Suillus clintonianus]|uniref:uncharacterized protein n=1 Tax=Suillus clintonianus TaxID=1904413 RepID=UPI001B87F696|nr:uncharacterized protein DEU56DRAFT_780486 [Suillus clintonianus]KAG2150522.1 hypothetical protein DEU56DRAFT_780486 [Suillus clintonianus]
MFVSSPDQGTALCTPPSPSKPRRRRPVPLRLQGIGVDPSLLVGKVLRRLSRSSKHPTLTLDFSDNTTFQILVDGYDPVHRGLPKELEMDSSLEQLLNTPTKQALVEWTIEDCALITLTDKAFESREREQRWDQNHSGVAFRFSEDRMWHCVWATLTDHDDGTCVFRSYDDVYIDQLHRSPRKRRAHVPDSPIDLR